MMRDAKKALALILALAVLGGCRRGDRPELGRVQGRITLNALPLAGARIGFTPLDGGRQSSATSDQQGCYELIYLRDLKGARLGLHRVEITTLDTESDKPEVLPSRYHAESTLQAEVNPGTNQIDFPLTSP